MFRQSPLRRQPETFSSGEKPNRVCVCFAWPKAHMIEEGFFPFHHEPKAVRNTYFTCFSLEGKMFQSPPNAWHIEAAVMSSYTGKAGT